MSVPTGSPDTTGADKSSTLTLANGQQVTTYQPQQLFDLSEADDTDLANLALGRPPHDDRLRVVSDALHAQLRDNFNYIPAEVQLDPNIVHGPRQTVDGSGASANWSGAEVFHPERKFLTGVIARWSIPAIEARTENTQECMATWIGIDDDGDLAGKCRAGIGCDVLRAANSDTKTFYPWFEWFPAAAVKITNLPVGPGDSVFITLYSDGDSQTTATFANETTGDATSVAFTAPPGGPTLRGERAEWIVAAPTVDGQQSTLPSYGEVFFTDCIAVTSPGINPIEKVRPHSDLTIDMHDSTGTVSKATAVTDTIIRCRYVGAHPTPTRQGVSDQLRHGQGQSS